MGIAVVTNDIELRECRKCGEEKEITGFSKNSNGNRSYTCHSCKREMKRKNRLERQKNVIQLLENNMAKKKAKVFYYKQPNSGMLDEITETEMLSLLEMGAIVLSEEENVYVLASKKLLRQYILLRDKYKCAYCGEWGDTMDHIYPKADGGEDSPNNLVCACQTCNVMKSNMHLKDFYEFVDNQVNELQEEITRRKEIMKNVKNGMPKKFIKRYSKRHLQLL